MGLCGQHVQTPNAAAATQIKMHAKCSHHNEVNEWGYVFSMQMICVQRTPSPRLREALHEVKKNEWGYVFSMQMILRATYSQSATS
jgi:hypothetical protein